MTSPQRPPGYPAAYEQRVELADGRVVHLRPVVPDDAQRLLDAVRHADPETLRRRFLGGSGPRTVKEADRLVRVDYVRRFALVALDEQDHGVGIARYEGASTWPAVEVAVAVDPRWRTVGLGTRLLADVVRRAAEVGALTVHAEFFSDNRAVALLLHELGLPEQRSGSHGVVEDDIDLDALRPLLREADERARTGLVAPVGPA